MLRTVPNPGPKKRYKRLIDGGQLKRDPAQAAAINKLQALHDALGDYRARGPYPVRQFFTPKKRKAPPKGLYLWGGVGRGKTMLMDLFHGSSDVPVKRRVHFHAFMQDVHARMHRLRQAAKTEDLIVPLADELSREASLICFDEVQVTDIADAMILGRLFQALFDRRVVMVATSNRPPEDLYKDGLNRQLFLPFIDLIRDRLDVYELTSPTDYRGEFLAAHDVYLSPLGPETATEMDAMFDEMTVDHDVSPTTVEVQGRKVIIPRAAHGIARASFASLCEAALGAADYIEIAARFHTLFLDDVPLMGPDKRNEARRFVTLIDELYEHKTKLIVSADAPAEGLYPAGDFSFEFERTASRLYEMRSAEYLAAEHLCHGKSEAAQ